MLGASLVELLSPATVCQLFHFEHLPRPEHRPPRRSLLGTQPKSFDGQTILQLSVLNGGNCHRHLAQ